MGEERAYIYRGVHAGHPAMRDAKQGRVRASNPQSKLSAREHSVGNCSGNSPFTSWTLSRELAIRHALKAGNGGILLRVPVGPPGPEDSWEWVHSHVEWFEDEVLLHGSRLDAEVVEW